MAEEMTESAQRKVGRPRVEEFPRACQLCGTEYKRKTFNGRLEDLSRFKSRNCCSRQCANSMGYPIHVSTNITSTHINECHERDLIAAVFHAAVFGDRDRRWLRSSEVGPFSFIWCCGVLDIDTDKARANGLAHIERRKGAR